jgi:hypothetical protein
LEWLPDGAINGALPPLVLVALPPFGALLAAAVRGCWVRWCWLLLVVVGGGIGG